MSISCTQRTQASWANSNPRQVAQTLRELLLAQDACVRWVQEIEIAGPGFLNLRLRPAAKQAVVPVSYTHLTLPTKA